MNDEQYKRYRKMCSDPIKCLYITPDKSKRLHFLISGSSGIKYKVTIPSDGKISCSCPDFKHGAKAQECVCKHCLYVILNILCICDIHHSFFKRCYFTPDEVKTIQGIYRERLSKNRRDN